MTVAVVIEPPDADAYSDAEIAAALRAPHLDQWLQQVHCGQLSRLRALIDDASAELGSSLGSCSGYVFAIAGGVNRWLRSTSTSELSCWVQLDDEALPGGLLELRDDDGSAAAMPRTKGTIVIARCDRAHRIGGSSAGRRLLHVKPEGATSWWACH